MTEQFEFANADRLALQDILGPEAPIDDLAQVVQNVQSWREYYRKAPTPAERKTALQHVSSSAERLLEALEALPDDVRDTYLDHTDFESAISSDDQDSEIDVDLLKVVGSIRDGADRTTAESSFAQPARGRPRDSAQLILACAVADTLRESGHEVTGYDAGKFVRVLEICAPAAGYELSEIRNIARKVI